MKAVLLLLFAVVAASYADDFDLDEIEKELQDSSLEEVETGVAEKRRNIFGWLSRKSSCSCEKTSCQCCAKPSIFGVQIDGCLKLTAQPELKQIVVDASALGNQVFSKAFPISETGQYCGNLPGKASFLSFCFNTAINGTEETGVTFCSQLDVNLKTTTAVSATFRCVELKDGQITFSENDMPSSNGILKLKVKNVFKKIIDHIRKPEGVDLNEE